MTTCHQCGECCRLKWTDGRRNVILNIWCPCYDPATRRCLVYSWRHTEQAKALRGGRECATTRWGVWRGLFPKGCAYVKWYHPHSEYDPSRIGLVPLGQWSAILARVAVLRRMVEELVQ